MKGGGDFDLLGENRIYMLQLIGGGGSLCKEWEG